jgi:hypothetical protein
MARSTRLKRTRPAYGVPAHTTLSLRDQLNQAVREFLDRERMACPKTLEGLVTLINALGHYREEGKALFPEVFVFDSLEDVLRVLPESEAVTIGEDLKNASTMAKALKKCAPLARRGWAVFIERRPKRFRYGLFRCGSTVLSLSPAELLIDKGDPAIRVFMLRQVAENVIQVRGVWLSSLLVYFGATIEAEVSPVPILQELVNSLAADVPDEIQEQVSSFYTTVFSGVSRAGHGALAGVMSGRKRALPPKFRDGIVLSPPLSIASKIQNVLAKSDCGSNTQLQACAALITGMLLSDGITLFGSDGTVRAYNVFIKHPKGPANVAGGARMRTFEVMCDLVGSDLVGAFIQSQDGRVEFQGKPR